MKRFSRYGNYQIWIYFEGPSRLLLATCPHYLAAIDVFWAIVHRYATDPRHVWFELIEAGEHVIEGGWPVMRELRPASGLMEISCNKGIGCAEHGKYRNIELRKFWQDCPIEIIEQLDKDSHTVYKLEE